MRSSNTVVFCAIDDLIPLSGAPLTGFSDFLDGLSSAGIPCVWVSSRNRHQLDPSIRKLGHGGPFIAEGGSGAYLPEDYFHLKPPRTVRLGRFTCIPVATPQPAASEALQTLIEDTGISLVPLRSLSPRELMQNTGLSRQEAEAVRQRDFDELFFFAGASDADIQKLLRDAQRRKSPVRPAGSLWSLTLGASVPTCVQEIRKLYDRALHAHAFTVAVTTFTEAPELGRACDRTILLTDRTSADTPITLTNRPAPKRLPLFAASTWAAALDSIQHRQF